MSLWRKIFNADLRGTRPDDKESMATTADLATRCNYSLFCVNNTVYLPQRLSPRGVTYETIPLKLDKSDVWSLILEVGSDDASAKALSTAAEDSAWAGYPMMMVCDVLYLVTEKGEYLKTPITSADLIASKDIVSAVPPR